MTSRPSAPASEAAVAACGFGKRAPTGTTLLELLVVVGIVAILSLVAIPSYRQYTLRAQRSDAKTALLKLQTNQERFYLTHKRYAGTADLAALGFAAPARSEKGAYAITVPTATATTYTAVATPIPGGAFDMTRDADCATFTITAQGVRGATGVADAAERCW